MIEYQSLGVEELVEATRAILANKAIRRFDKPVELASGQLSEHFVDGKLGFAHADDLRVACLAMHGLVQRAGIEYDAVGGLTLGADHLCVGISMVAGKSWFIVRKEPKKRGTARRIEGVLLAEGMRVLIVEDVVSTGGSMLQAIDAASATGAVVVAATTLLDRGEHIRNVLDDRRIPYFPVSTYRHFEIPPVLAPGP